MPQIVTKSYFNKNNGLYIPLASVENPGASTSTAGPTNSAALDALCVSIEKSLLLNALGTVLYNELQTALANLDADGNEKWKNLVNGEDYDGKFWYGLKHDLTFIAQKVYETFQTQNTDQKQTKSKKSIPETPAYKIAAANQAFLRNYQGGYLQCPEVYDVDGVDFVDFYGQADEIEVSFYRYMLDRKTLFTGWDVSKFRVYDAEMAKNSFGL